MFQAVRSNRKFSISFPSQGWNRWVFERLSDRPTAAAAVLSGGSSIHVGIPAFPFAPFSPFRDMGEPRLRLMGIFPEDGAQKAPGSEGNRGQVFRILLRTPPTEQAANALPTVFMPAERPAGL